MRFKCFIIDQAAHNVCRVAVHNSSHHSSHRDDDDDDDDDDELHEAHMMKSRLRHSHNWFAVTEGDF